MKKEEIEFLKDLQKELQTQPNDGNADPVFWVVGDYKWVAVPEGSGDRGIIYLPDTDGSYTFGEYRENILDGSDEIELETDEYIDLYNARKVYEIKQWIDDHEARVYDLYEKEEKHVITPDTFFITKKECQAHIESNRHRYTDEVHTYAMTAWRSPQVAKLWEILENADWTALETNTPKTNGESE